MRKKTTREKIRQQVLVSSVKDEIDVANMIPTKAEFSYAVAVMDKFGGQHEEEERVEDNEGDEGNKIGGRLAACICIYSRTVICNGQRYVKPISDHKERSDRIDQLGV